MNLSVLHPGLLAAGLACVAIPIIIHYLLRRKRTPIEWGAMRFLLEAHRRRKRRLTLEQLLLLLARCLLIAMIAIALAGPLLGSGGGTGGPRTLVVLLDDSLTSKVLSSGAQAEFTTNKQHALDAIDALEPAAGDRAAVVTLARPARLLIAQPTSDLGTARRAIEAAQPTDAGVDWAGALAAADALLGSLEPAERTTLLIASALRAGSLPPAEQTNSIITTPDAVRAPRPATFDPAQIAITSVDVSRRLVLAGGSSQSPVVVRVTLARFGDAAAQTTPVRVEHAIARTTLATATARWSAGQTEQSLAIAFATTAGGAPTALGPVPIRVTVQQPDALNADNARSIVLTRRDALRVAIVAPPNPGTPRAFAPADWLEAALAPSSAEPIVTHRIEPAELHTDPLAGIDALAILAPGELTKDGWRRVGAFTDAGGFVLLTPQGDRFAQPWTDAAADALALPWRFDAEPVESGPRQVLRQPTPDPLLAALDAELDDLLRPVRVARALSAHALAGNPGASRTLLSLADGSPWLELSADRNGAGTLAYLGSAFDTDWTDLPARPLFVPLVHELFRQSIRAGAGGEFIAGRSITADPGAVELIEENTSGARRVDPTTRRADPIRSAGLARAIDAQGRTLAQYAVNPDASASDTKPTSTSDAQRRLDELAPGARIVWLDTDSDQPNTRGPSAAADPGKHARMLTWLALLCAGLLALGEPVLGRIASHAEGAA